MHSFPFDDTIIAPCGMNCGVCRAHLRGKNPCESLTPTANTAMERQRAVRKIQEYAEERYRRVEALRRDRYWRAYIPQSIA
ncbi:MAG: hypothetical protein LUQ64_05905, partial [Methanomicrobiales archaeon]|nr:hypothetical protein [Methanomicrobiales archaeon]